ncbi:MAG: hypothetical protein FJ386_14350 [Verrucomicrobia bacterium]|nr:hypothetical protein [Verrucomicrobiota bacterium]
MKTSRRLPCSFSSADSRRWKLPLLAPRGRSAGLPTRGFALSFLFVLAVAAALPARAQMLLNVDFGVGAASAKTGFAGTGRATNDHWNLYTHYNPRFAPGMPLVLGSRLDSVKLSDGTPTTVAIAVTNAPGVWGNSTGDAMYDNYIFAMNRSNIVVTITGLEPGRYNLHLYGHADPDATGEQNSIFTVRSANTNFGPMTVVSSAGWKLPAPMVEGHQFVVFRDLPVAPGVPLIIEVAPGPNGVAVLNGLQLSSKGTAPPKLVDVLPPALRPALTNLVVHSIRYDGKVGETEARFAVSLTVESQSTNDLALPLFTGDVAVLPGPLPKDVRIVRGTGQYRLHVGAPGTFDLKFDVVAKITRAEPWNSISFNGPPAAIASVVAQAASAGMEVQLLGGTPLDNEKNKSRAEGFLAADRLLSMRWQSKTTEITRKSLITVDTTAAAQVSPTVVKFTTALRYEILQAPVAKLTFAFPATQTLTRLQGEQIRDWRVERMPAGAQPPGGGGQAEPMSLLTVEFIKPVEKSYALTLFTEQPIETTPVSLNLRPPQPLDVERDSGSFTLSVDDTVVEVESVTGLRQVNAAPGSLAAYRFHGWPLGLGARVQRIEPVLKSADRVTARLEETRLLVTHSIALTVEKAGIYHVEFAAPTNFVVADVKGDGVEDWKLADGKIRVNFTARVLGMRTLHVSLEQAHKTFPAQIALAALRPAGATKETAFIGAASSPGIRLKTAELTNAREIPVTQLAQRTGEELLAFTADDAAWRLALATERLPARIVADVFNLMTIGDGLVGGSATMRFGLINQGVQEFKVLVPAHWKNIEFTGPNIRRKEQASNVWTISLQDKAWGGYTLVVTYDYQFDPKKAALDLAGAHAEGIERETGSVAVTTAASLKLLPRPVAEPLRVIDPSELAETDRALVTRPVLLAYRYTGSAFAHTVDATRYDQERVLDAVADRTQITSVLTDAGEMLTQASFMVKNNDKQTQRFKLPPKADFWGCYVNNAPMKAERDGEWLLVSLPRGANRDEAFAVDIVYAQKLDALKGGLWPQAVALTAPQTDVPNTYAEWELYVPPSRRVTDLGGTMAAPRGLSYGLRDAWRLFVQNYSDFISERGLGLAIAGFVALFAVSFVGQLVRRGMKGAVKVVAVFGVFVVLGAILVPMMMQVKSSGLAGGYMPQSATEPLAERVDDVRSFATRGGEEMPRSSSSPAEQRARPMGGPAAKYANGPQQSGQLVDGSAQGRRERAAGSVLRMEEFTVGAAPAQPMTPPMAGLPAPAKPAGGAGGPADESRNSFAVGSANSPAPAGAGLGVGAGEGFTTVANPAAATVAGIRSIRIDLPRSGRPLLFTKVLNSGRDPLTVEMSVMKAKVFTVLRSVLQLVAFLAGLGLVLAEWRRVESSSLRLAFGLALGLGSVTHLALASRTLHFAFIAAAPVLALALFLWVAWKLWPARTRNADFGLQNDGGDGATATPAGPTGPTDPTSSSSSSNPIPPAAAGIALFFLLGASASGQSAFRNPQSPVETNAVSLTSATYTGTIREKVAEFTAALTLASASTNPVTFPLFGDDVALREFSVKAGHALLVREGSRVSVLLTNRGEAVLEVKLAAKVGGDVAKRRLQFGLPAALASKLSATLDEKDADVEFPSAVSFQRVATGDQTRIDAIIGSEDRVELTWTPRVKRVAEMEATLFTVSSTLVSLGGGVLNARTVIDYQIAQGELRQARVKLPAGQRLLRVEGQLIRTWELLTDDTLVVDLVKGATASYKLTLETEQLLAAIPAPGSGQPLAVKIAIPSTTAASGDVKRETGLVGVAGGEELTVSVEGGTELQRVDSAEFARLSPTLGQVNAGVWRYFRPGFSLTAQVSQVQAQLEAGITQRLRIAAEELRLAAEISYTVRKAGIFQLRAQIPDGWRIESVGYFDAAMRARGSAFMLVNNWTEKKVGAARVLEVPLRERTIGSVSLLVILAQTVKETPKSLAVPAVHPLGVEKLNGYVAVATDTGIAVKTENFDGATEVPAATVPAGVYRGMNQVPTLAFKFISTTPVETAPWKLSVTTEQLESWIRAEVANIVTVSETLLSGRVLIRYDIANSPVKEFQIRVPVTVTNVDISGGAIRRRDQTNDVWKIELQNKVRGTFTLVVTWEQPRKAGSSNAPVEIPVVEALGVERETGAVAVLGRAPLQVTERSTTGEMHKIDPRELPEWSGLQAGVSGKDSVLLAYRYLRPGWKLTANAQRYQEAGVLQALVDSLRLMTVVAEDGQMMTEMTLAVRNNGRQFLEVKLPKDATVWSAFVAGQPVRPSRQADRIMLPLERTGADDAPILVEVTYVGRERFPKTRGGVALASPTLDVPLKNARWDLYLPPDYEYAKFTGSMTHEKLGVEPVRQVFSLGEYNRREAQVKEQRFNESKIALGNLKSLVSSGKDNLANGANLEQLKKLNKDVQDEESKKEVAELEMSFKRAQSRNLVDAQRAWSAENSYRFGANANPTDMPAPQQQQERAQGQEGGRGAQAGEGLVSYDAAAADAQWDMICRAQEITTTTVAPLRANLPTHGQLLSFTQVLQTELNKALTVEFRAKNLAETPWFRTAFWFASAFAALWLATAFVCVRRNGRA